MADTNHFNSVGGDSIQDQIPTDGKDSTFIADLRSGNSKLWVFGQKQAGCLDIIQQAVCRVGTIFGNIKPDVYEIRFGQSGSFYL